MAFLLAIAVMLVLPGPFSVGAGQEVRSGEPNPLGPIPGARHLAPGGTATDMDRASLSPAGPTSQTPAPRTAPSAPGVRPAGTGVDPLLDYSREPAPMGVADFGVTGVRSGAYEYASNSFQGSALVRSMRLSTTGGGSVVAFELNAVLLLRWGGVNYSYWIQNGLHVDTSSRLFSIGGAYVWNFSAPNARLSPSELQGSNGSVLLSDTYYYIPTCNGLAGQCSTLNWPTTLTARVNATSSLGVPLVQYEYDLGNGWVRYDTVSFLHMSGATVVGFVVDGYDPTPYASGLFYDAEWDWVAAGGGSTGQDEGSALQMSLDFWNGHNYQETPNAWDFGADTGESSSNVSDTLSSAAPGGALDAQLASGPGTLGVLYNQTERGFLDVSVPTVPAGTLEVDGVPLAFEGSAANLTLAAGPHAISLLDYSNASAMVSVLAGQTAYVNLSGAGRTAFVESGLPPGTPWGLSIDGMNGSTTASTLTFPIPNGTYSINYSAVPGFYRLVADPSEVSVPVPSPVVVAWAPFRFEVPLTEEGLPAGTMWWVNASGQVVRGASMTLEVAVPNGSTEYAVGSAYEFVPAPSAGTIDVTAGAFLPVVVQFSYRPSFIVGSVSPSNASLTIGGLGVPVSGGSFNDSVLPGTYTIVASAPGYTTQTLQVNTTAGNVTPERIVLTPVPSSGSGSAPNSASGPSPLLWVGIAAAAAALIAVGLLLLRRRPRG